MATLNAKGDLQISGLPLFGNIPTTTSPAKSALFRLWNDIRSISDFVADLPTLLIDGIHLKFDSPTTGNSNYAPEDYWTFSVRAGGISNPKVLIDNELPHGIQYHHVPLGILNWNGAADINGGQIEDYRDTPTDTSNR
jgi:hypothetical protein